MSFMCYDCKEVFDEPKKVQESRGEFWGMPAFETMYYCPCCGSEAIDEEDIVLADLEEEEEEEEEE